MDLKIPYRDRDQRLDDPSVLALPRALEDREERLTADRVLLAAMGDPGLETVGDLLDLFEQVSPEERRRVADAARESAGIKTFAAIHREAELERFRRAAPVRRDADGRSYQRCHEAGCMATPINPATGLEVPTSARAWYCPEHRAGHESDMQPWTRSYRYSETGVLIDGDDDAAAEREQERRQREEASQRQRREEAEAERREQAAERCEYRRARDLQHEREDLSTHGPMA